MGDTNYSSTWENIANQLTSYYLLNVKQGFWINHSIRQLMRTILYSTDKIWSDDNIFDVDEAKKGNSLQQLSEYNKGETAKLLLENIKLLDMETYSKNTTNEDQVLKDQDKFSQEIFSGENTLEEYY